MKIPRTLPMVVPFFLLALLALVVALAPGKEKSAQQNQAALNGPAPTSYVSNAGGRIEKIENGKIAISSLIPQATGEMKTESVIVSVGSDTAILKEVPKDKKTFAAEQAAYTKDPKGEPPLPYTPQTLTLSDLKEGMLVNIAIAQEKDAGGIMHAIRVLVLSVGQQ